MKITNILATSIAALALGTMAQAATVVHLTGSTAFRASTVQAIENLMIAGPGGGNYVGAGTIAAPTGPAISAGKFKCSFQGTTGAANEQGATYLVIEGTISGANNPVIVKCAWAGSTGGLITTTHQVDVTWTATSGFLSANVLTGAETNVVGDGTNIIGVANIPANFTGDGDTSLKTQGTMADSQQGSAGIAGLVAGGTNGDGIAAVVPFEWVANNGVTAPVKFTGCSTTAGNPVVTYTGAIYTPTGAAATNAQISAVQGGICGGPSIIRNDGVTTSVGGSGSFTLATAPTVTATGQTYVAAVTGTNPVTNLTVNQATQALAIGVLTSQLTGAASTTPALASDFPVYVGGRNFDSGTRLSELAETGIGIFGTQQVVCPTFVNRDAGAAGTYPIPFPNGGTTGSTTKSAGDPSNFVSKMDLWGAENIFPAPYTNSYVLGNSGYNGGGALAGFLSTPGSTTAGATSAPSAPFYDTLNSGVATGGWVIGYLGRSDAKTACKTTVGANTAHRITFNGYADWVGGTGDSAMAADGSLTGGYNNTAIQEGQYQAWEVEYLYQYAGASADQQTVLNKLTDALLATPTSASGLNYGSMNVSKANEGAPIYHN